MFANTGEATAPCGVPVSVGVTFPSSIIDKIDLEPNELGGLLSKLRRVAPGRHPR